MEFGIHPDSQYMLHHAAHNRSRAAVNQQGLLASNLPLSTTPGSKEARGGSAASPAAGRRSLTSVGRLISNRSSRLAFQWLMMSASFLLSSSLFPDMVDGVGWWPCPFLSECASMYALQK